MNPRNTGKRGYIVYEIQPSNPQYKSQIVRVKLIESSHFKKEDLIEAHEIIEKGNKAKFDIKMFATDADSKTNKLHTDFFNYLEEYIGTFEQKIILYTKKVIIFSENRTKHQHHYKDSTEITSTSDSIN